MTARTRAAAGGAAPGRYTEARQKVPNGEREVHARQCGGHVTVRARLGVRLGQMLDGDGGGGLGGLSDAINARNDGATAAELAAALGAEVTAVAPAIEELQLDGTVYERGGRFFAL